MRILIAHSFYRLPGGEDRYVEQQAELLRTKHDVALLWRRSDRLPSRTALVRRMVYSPHNVAGADAAIAEFTPNVIHLHNAYPALGPAVHLAARRHGIPVVMTVHNMRLRCPNGVMFTEGEICRRCERGNYVNAALHRCFPSRAQGAAYATALWWHRFGLRLENKVEHFVAPSEFMARRLVEWGIDRDKISTVRPFTPLPPDPPLPGQNGVFLGRLSPEKGVDVLLRALARAGDPPFQIAGDGPIRATLEAMAATLGLNNTVFLGSLDGARAADLLRAARFVVIPSTCEENAPMAAIEALAWGRPVVVSDIGGLPELAAEGRGLRATPHDVDELAEAIRRVVDDSDEVQIMGARARRFAAKALAAEAHLGGLEATYSRIA